MSDFDFFSFLWVKRHPVFDSSQSGAEIFVDDSGQVFVDDNADILVSDNSVNVTETLIRWV